jgi:glycosyltransferase involved in cell wall biosynthesis
MSAPFKVAYVMSRFPKITETFILYEMLAVMEQGIQVEIFPLMRENTQVMHPEAVPLVATAHFTEHISPGVLASNMRALFLRPLAYVRTLVTALRATWGSRRFFIGVLSFFAKSVHMGRLMREFGVDHVHAHFASFPAATAYIIHHVTGIPYSFTAHGSDLHRDKHFLCEKVRDAKFVIAISQYNQSSILDHCGDEYSDKVHVVHCGVDTNAFRPSEKGEPEADQRPLRIVCTGTLHEVKGQTYLVEACAELQRRGVSFECHFVGDGPDKAALQAQVEAAQLTDKFVFHGNVPREQVIATLALADVVVQPSVPSSDGRREGIPVALMEAMACGAPVVASELSGIPELIDSQVSGILVPPRDAPKIAETLEMLSRDPALRRKLGQAGRQRILDHFNLTLNAETLSVLFREIPS